MIADRNPDENPFRRYEQFLARNALGRPVQYAEHEQMTAHVPNEMEVSYTVANNPLDDDHVIVVTNADNTYRFVFRTDQHGFNDLRGGCYVVDPLGDNQLRVSLVLVEDALVRDEQDQLEKIVSTVVGSHYAVIDVETGDVVEQARNDWMGIVRLE